MVVITVRETRWPRPGPSPRPPRGPSTNVRLTTRRYLTMRASFAVRWPSSCCLIVAISFAAAWSSLRYRSSFSSMSVAMATQLALTDSTATGRSSAQARRCVDVGVGVGVGASAGSPIAATAAPRKILSVSPSMLPVLTDPIEVASRTDRDKKDLIMI